MSDGLVLSGGGVCSECGCSWELSFDGRDVRFIRYTSRRPCECSICESNDGVQERASQVIEAAHRAIAAQLAVVDMTVH